MLGFPLFLLLSIWALLLILKTQPESVSSVNPGHQSSWSPPPLCWTLGIDSSLVARMPWGSGWLFTCLLPPLDCEFLRGSDLVLVASVQDPGLIVEGAQPVSWMNRWMTVDLIDCHRIQSFPSCPVGNLTSARPGHAPCFPAPDPWACRIPRSGVCPLPVELLSFFEVLPRSSPFSNIVQSQL